MTTGFLGDSFKGMKGSLKEGEAVLTILIAAVLADGLQTEEESTELDALVVRSKTIRKYRKDDPEGYKRLRQELPGKMRNYADLIQLTEEAAASLIAPPEADRAMISKSVFAHAADIVFADSVVPDREQNFLEKLAVRLGFEAVEARTIVSFIRAKNEY